MFFIMNGLKCVNPLVFQCCLQEALLHPVDHESAERIRTLELVNAVIEVPSLVFRMVFWWMSSACHRFPPHKQGMDENSRTSTGNTFICRVTFILARPFDLSPLQY